MAVAGELPEGFYADSEADKRARGINLKKRTIEEEMADFEVRGCFCSWFPLIHRAWHLMIDVYSSYP